MARRRVAIGRAADTALADTVSIMDTDVFLEDIGPRKTLAATFVRTAVGLLAAMGSHVTGEMGRPSERLVAVGPGADMGLPGKAIGVDHGIGGRGRILRMMVWTGKERLLHDSRHACVSPSCESCIETKMMKEKKKTDGKVSGQVETKEQDLEVQRIHRKKVQAVQIF